MAEKKVNSIGELIQYLKEDIGKYKGPVWYRGQSQKGWKLQSSFIRECANESEMNMINRFRQSATLLLNPNPNTLMDWLFIMQHHGVPTRLLDWTESPLVALYFACNEHNDLDGALWILRPVELNKKSGIKPEYPYYIPSLEDDIVENYFPENLAGERKSELLPIAALVPRNNPRMQSQLGVFTISHRDKTSIENIHDKSHTTRYIIPKRKKGTMLKDLKLIGIQKFQLFPELSSIGEAIKEDIA